jgi:hypothetical protein
MPSKKRTLSGGLIVLLWILAVALLSAAFTGIVIWRSSSRVYEDASQAAKTVATAFQHSMNLTPEVRVNSVVVIEATTPAREWITARKQLRVRESLEHTWLHSTKTFEIEATYTAKAGFDFQIPLCIQVDSRNLGLTADLPPPKILSLSMSNLRILQDESGLWNKLNAADREKAFRSLKQKARGQFLESDLLAKASLEGEKLIREILEASAVEIGIQTPPRR